jgi:hypothetical protein
VLRLPLLLPLLLSPLLPLLLLLLAFQLPACATAGQLLLCCSYSKPSCCPVL